MLLIVVRLAARLGQHRLRSFESRSNSFFLRNYLHIVLSFAQLGVIQSGFGDEAPREIAQFFLRGLDRGAIFDSA